MKEDSSLLAILGPTNTGKTYLAFERLISYKSGIFGFPLRLLARENYDKAISKLGIQNVALITGEEKIFPKNAKYFFCTVESMPINIEVECVAIDEVQLSADYERGHIFTDRILHFRGIYETIFLGSATIKNILQILFPNIKIENRNRFSKLSFISKQSLSKLKPRSAIIAFNINSVYEIAESLRMHKGGAAVVLGSLSPRTRNAQVEVYENNKVDYLVATDAIGMGLNLNINHVSFSALQKFDGRYTRNLKPAELGQIAGRAGRHLNDGTFGYLKGAGNLDPYIIESIEEHRFESIQKIYWRNSDIDFSSIKSVIDSLKKFPINKIFIHKKNAEDEINFRTLSNIPSISAYLNNSQSISLLWDVCRIPDFQKIFNDFYLKLLENIFLTLIKNDGYLSEEWLQEKILRTENYNGGIDELSSKISNIRTWTYIANQSAWIENSQFWQEKTHKIENMLSDHLHTALTNRFIDFSASYFVDTKKRGEEVSFEVDQNKSIKLNGQIYGYINGFDLELNVSNSKSLFSLIHVKKSIRSMIEEKINNFLKAPLDSINLGDLKKLRINEDIKIHWGDEPIAKLVKGMNIFSPKVEVFNTEFLESDKKILISKKLQEWLEEKITTTLKPITETIDNSISSEIRSIIFNLFNNLGTMLVSDYSSIIKNLNEHDKASISRAGIRIGTKFFFMPNLIKKKPMELKAMLWQVFNKSNISDFYPFPSDGRVSFESQVVMPDSYWFSIGYKYLDKFLLRADVFERVFFLSRQKIKYGPFIDLSDLMNPIGCNSDQLVNIMKFCGFESSCIGDNRKLFFLKSKNQMQKIKKIKLKKKDIIQIENKKEKVAIKINLKKKNISNVSIKINTKKKNIPIVSIKINTKKKSISKIPNKNAKSPEKKDIADPNSPFAVLQKLL